MTTEDARGLPYGRPRYATPVFGAANIIFVTSANVAEVFDGPADSTKLHVIDGVVDCSGVTIEVPATGLFMAGLDQGLSRLQCAAPGETLITSSPGGSGPIYIRDLTFELTGAGSQVFDITDVTPATNLIQLSRVAFLSCASLGEITDYGQVVEESTIRFGGTPSLTLSGTFGGYRTSIGGALGLDPAMTEPLFKAGTALVFGSRFLSDINADLPALPAFADFAPNNFAAPSLFALRGALVTRNGVSNAGDPTLLPNIDASDLEADLSANQGLPNTFEGGRLTLTTETTTVITSSGQWFTLAGTWTASSLAHFDSPANGQLRHLGINPREYRYVFNFVVDGGPNDDIGVRLVKWDDSASTFVPLTEQRRQINSLIGFRDVGFWSFVDTVILDQNDYVYAEVRNNSDTTNVTLELESYILVEARQ